MERNAKRLHASIAKSFDEITMRSQDVSLPIEQRAAPHRGGFRKARAV